jgi:glucosylceramidase
MMVRVITSAGDVRLQESSAGIFVSSHVAGARGYRYGGPAKIQKLPILTLDPRQEYQEILGFGAAFTDASCYLFNLLDPDARESVLSDLFSPSGLGLNIGRLTVAQCDFGRVAYSYDDEPDDVSLKHFSVDYDRGYIIPTIKQAVEINPDLFLLASPWSPPGWMKTSGVMTGGWMLDRFLEPYARYYLRYLQEYAKVGIRIGALTVQNEAETDQLGLMPACYWHPEQELKFIRDHLSPLLKKNGLDDIEIWLMDHNYVMWRRVVWMLQEDPAFRALVKGIAWHPYEGLPSVMSDLKARFPELDAHVTEWGFGFSDGIGDVCAKGAMSIDILRNWSRSIFCWNIMLDEAGKPHIGPFFTPGEQNGGGVLQFRAATREVRRGSGYYALGHFSKFVKRGARRIASDCDMPGIQHVAFRNPDGEFVVVIANPGEVTELSLALADRCVQVPLPAGSMTTLVFE